MLHRDLTKNSSFFFEKKEKIVHVRTPQIQEHSRQRTVEANSFVPQIVEEISEVMRLRATEQIAKKLLLGFVAALDRV